MQTTDRIERQGRALIEKLELIADDPSIPEQTKLGYIIHGTSLLCAIVAAQPIPFADALILTPIQVGMVSAMSRVMGNPIGKHGAGEIVASVLGVVGFGLVAQHTVLGLYKIGLPFLAGFTTIPLVYAATYGIGHAARAVLDARRKDQTLSDEELRRIKQEYERKAKAEKRDWSFDGVKQEYQDFSRRAEEYGEYRTQIQAQDRDIAAEQEKLEQARTARELLEDKIRNLQARLDVATDEWVEAAELGEDLLEQVTALKEQLAAKEREQAASAEKLSRLTARRLETLHGRYHVCYPNVQLLDSAYCILAELPDSRLNAVERQVGFLQHDPSKANFRDKIQGSAAREIGFDGDGRIYVLQDGPRYTLLRIGDKKTQLRDIEWLRANAAQ